MELMQNFGLTFSKYVRENSRTLLIRLLGLLAILIALALWIGYVYNTESWNIGPHDYDRAHLREMGFFSVILIFIAAAGASEVMGMMDTKERRISTLMTPSTQLSKFVTAWIINGPVLVGVYVAFAYIADFVRYLVYSSLDIAGCYVAPFSFGSINAPSEVIEAYFMFIILIQALFVLGGTVWSGKSFIKTAIFLVALCMVYSAFVSLGFSLTVVEGGNYFKLFNNEPDKAWIWVADIAVSLGIYVLAYFRFKESEIINRW